MERNLPFDGDLNPPVNVTNPVGAKVERSAQAAQDDRQDRGKGGAQVGRSADVVHNAVATDAVFNEAITICAVTHSAPSPTKAA
jgi:hypothetical protein